VLINVLRTIETCFLDKKTQCKLRRGLRNVIPLAKKLPAIRLAERSTWYFSVVVVFQALGSGI
jgi:hypothetical protein